MHYAPSRNGQWCIYDATDGKIRTPMMSLRALILQRKAEDESGEEIHAASH